MDGFIPALFSWQNFIVDIIYSVVLAGFVRGIVWLFNVPLRGNWRELWFWLMVPAFLLIIALFGTPLNQATRQPISTPLLRGQIEATFTGTEGQHPSSVPFVTLIVSVRNLETPSIAEGWSLSVMPPGGQTFSATPYHISNTMTLEREGNSPITLYGSDQLYNKIGITPIATGSLQRGILSFRIAQAPLESLNHSGTRLTLSYEDVIGKTTQLWHNLVVSREAFRISQDSNLHNNFYPC
jgi:hypothetical protein